MTWEVAWRAPGERLVVQRRRGPGGHLRHRVVSNEPRDGVVVLARCGDHLAFVDHDRPATGRRLLELPRGQGETDDADEAAVAQRELREETGLHLQDAVVLGRVWPDSGLLGDCVAVVAGRATIPAVTDVHAEMPVVWVAMTDLRRRIASGEVADGITLAALASSAAVGWLPSRSEGLNGRA